MYSANTLVFTTGALIFMTRISPKLTLWAFLPLPIASILVQYFGTRIHERFERIQAKFSDISARAQENFSGARLIRAYAQEDAEIALFETENTDYINRAMPLARLMGMLWPTLEMMLGFALVIVLWVGGQEVLLPSHHGRRLHGLHHVHDPAHLACHRPRLGDQHLSARHRLHGSASTRSFARSPRLPMIPRSSPCPPSTEIRGEIEFRNLTFAYDFQSSSESRTVHCALLDGRTRRRRPAQRKSEDSRRNQPCHRRSHRLRQIHPGLADSAHHSTPRPDRC